MQIKIETGDITRNNSKAIIVNLFEGVTRPGGATGAVDRALGGAITALIRQGEFRGKRGEVVLLHSLGKIRSPRVIIAGLGKAEDFNVNVIRDVTGTALRRARAAKASSVATILHGAGIAGLDPEACAQAIAEGAILGAYRFRKYKNGGVTAEESDDIATLTISESDRAKKGAISRGVERGEILAQATCHTRDMANEPANALNPEALAARAKALAADAGLQCTVMDEKQLARMGMGGVLGVGAGSTSPPRFIVLKYRGDPRSKETLGLLGKGITFDSGGISIKPAAGMEAMKGDMSGAASVISATWAIGKLKPKINVTCLVPTAENMPSGSATKPGDVLRAMNGKTIEVINTDAEGRLILADAICYARQEGLSPIVDVATLTGAMMIALGPGATGFFATSDELATDLTTAGETAGEKMWRFPLIDDYREGLRSNIADIKNTGPRNGGAINAAEFLRFFAEDSEWAHIDMAGTDEADKDKGVLVKGSTGIPTRTLINFVLSRAQA